MVIRYPYRGLGRYKYIGSISMETAQAMGTKQSDLIFFSLGTQHNNTRCVELEICP
jgi:hypothetical protein